MKITPLYDIQGSIAFELEAIIKWTDRLAHRMDRVCAAGDRNDVARTEFAARLDVCHEIRDALREASATLQPAQLATFQRFEESGS